MTLLNSLILVAQVLSAIGVIVLVLLQHGKGADMGAAFGGGASGSLFGATGSANFLSRFTAVLATIFFLSTLALSFTGSRQNATPRSIMEQPAGAPATGVPGVPAPQGVPAAPGAAAPAPAEGGAVAPATGVPAAPAAAGSATGGDADAAVQKNRQSTQIPK
ncbi:MAG: preprotein translocase subunit SecG [Betaproteobacteria bacterium]|nr:preprotein translocase subunit SecG [Betaproteobacteria bacterium]